MNAIKPTRKDLEEYYQARHAQPMAIIRSSYNPRKWQIDLHRGLEDKRFSVIVAHRRAGKTVAMVNHILKCASANRHRQPQPRYAYIAPTYSQARRICWDYFKEFSKVIPGTRALENHLELRLPHNDATIMLFGAGNSRERLRGVHLDGVVIDEPASVDPSVWYDIVFPMLSDRKGWASFIGTVHGFDLLYQIWQAALKDPDWFTYMAQASKTGVLDKEELALARRQMGDDQYNQEYECQWLARSTGSFIAAEDVAQAVIRHYPDYMIRTAPIIFGIDPARKGGDMAVLVVRQGNQMLGCHTWKDLDIPSLTHQIIRLIERYRPAAVFCDSVGFGIAIVDRLNELGYTALGVNGGSRPAERDRYFNKRAEMWGAMRDWINAGGALVDDSTLCDDLVAPKYSYNEQGQCVLEKKEDLSRRLNRSTDRGDALAFTFAYPVETNTNRYRPTVALTKYSVLRKQPIGN